MSGYASISIELDHRYAKSRGSTGAEQYKSFLLIPPSYRRGAWAGIGLAYGTNLEAVQDSGIFLMEKVIVSTNPRQRSQVGRYKDIRHSGTDRRIQVRVATAQAFVHWIQLPKPLIPHELEFPLTSGPYRFLPQKWVCLERCISAHLLNARLC